MSKWYLSLSPDSYSRYFIISEIIEKNYLTKKISILEFGGSGGFLYYLLADKKLSFELTIIDTLPPQKKIKKYKYIQKDATQTGYSDNSYDVVVSTDVLEHIPDEKKIRFIEESIRISRELVIIAAPFDNILTEYAEKEANSIFKKYFGVDHIWLKEHFKLKKPKKELVEKILIENNLPFIHFESNHISNWVSTIIPNFLAEKKLITTNKIQIVNKFFNKNLLNMGDFSPPGYRDFYVIFKNKNLKREFSYYFNTGINMNLKTKFQKDIYNLFAEDILNLGKRLEDISDNSRSLADQIGNLQKHINIVENELLDIKSSTFYFFANKYYGYKGSIIRKAKLFNVFLFEMLFKPEKYLKLLKTLISKGPKGLIERINKATIYNDYSKQIFNQYQLWFKSNYPTKPELKSQTLESKQIKIKPKISILTPIYNTPEKFLRQCIESVLEQSYENWELILVDDASDNPILKKIIQEYARKDKRIKYLFRKENGHICRASNQALALATGEYVSLLDHDDILWPNALFEVVRCINKFPNTNLIYTDEDKLEEDGITHSEPFFKPDWSPDYLLSCNYITHFSTFKKSLINKIGGFRIGTEGAQDWDIILRATNEITKRQKPEGLIVHIPKILYSWRKSDVSAASAKAAIGIKSYAYSNQRKVLENNLAASSIKSELTKTDFLGCWRVKYKIVGNPLVSIIIPTKDKFEYIYKCIKSLKKSTYKNFELILVDTGSSDAKVWKLYKEVKKDFNKFKLLNWKNDFNFSAVCNFGAEKSSGKYLIFLNNDTEIISTDWIESLLEHAQRKNIGAVGVKLLYPDGKIQHAGIITGVGGVANHIMKGYPDNIPQGFPMLLAKDLIRDVCAITGACLAISREKFHKVGGFNEIFKIAFNDVDLCLKLYYKEGLFNLYTPFATLLHHENTSVGNPFKGTRNYSEFMRENELMYKFWEEKIDNDPFYNKNLTKVREDFSIDV